MPISRAPISPASWLPSLKAAQLNRIAFVTGISSSGTKPVLIQRLDDALQSCPSIRTEEGTAAYVTRQHGLDGAGVQSRQKDGQASRAMSILSIDMGIRNLAFAHLIVPQTWKDSAQPRVSVLPILNAWTRLAISAFPPQSPSSSSPQVAALNFHADVARKTKTKQSESTIIASSSSNREEKSSVRAELKENTADKESFAPDVYASHAYTLITSLIAAYKPTHILIERQRFRSGGGSSVQEWTIRVGVFEGMLYAVLKTLNQESNRQDLGIAVQGVEPQRVARYWIEKDRPASGKQPETKHKKLSSKEGKKAKIDLVGRWLTAWRELHPSVPATPEESLRIQLSDNSQANIVAKEYLKKWGGKSKLRAATSSPANAPATRELREQNLERTARKPKAKEMATQSPASAGEPNSIVPGITPCHSNPAVEIGK
ncbi:MAG TPA: mitochondrial RNA-splicing protein MRS1, partial [Nitrososphaera sp.]|nr:mitochondrial RNA-splicing protein MRS1 [Nitrososphaera sp.]